MLSQSIKQFADSLFAAGLVRIIQMPARSQASSEPNYPEVRSSQPGPEPAVLFLLTSRT